MGRPDQEKTLTLQGEEFRIRKFVPDTAAYWAFRLFGEAVGAIGFNLKAIKEQLPQMVKNFSWMQYSEFIKFKNDCLTHVDAKFDGKYYPLVNSEGYYTKIEITGPQVGILTIMSFAFSMQDFFDLSLIAEALGEEFKEAMKKATETGSENLSSSQSGLNTGSNTNSGTVPTL